MKLTFGLALDGFRLAPGAVVLGELTCGPAGILGWLEARLGLARRWPTAVERLMAYERALAAASTGSFYLESFDKDPLAVAETLLGWRDELILSGWARSSIRTGAVRPDVLFELEARVDPAVRTGMGDRVLDVLAALPVRRPLRPMPAGSTPCAGTTTRRLGDRRWPANSLRQRIPLGPSGRSALS